MEDVEDRELKEGCVQLGKVVRARKGGQDVCGKGV